MNEGQIPINLVFEDNLQEAVMLRLLGRLKEKYSIGELLNSRGFGKIKKNINKYNKASHHMPYFILTDLDRKSCPLKLIKDWFDGDPNPNLIFRIAIPEVESWLIADIEGFQKFTHSQYTLPKHADNIEDGKDFIFKIIRKSTNKKLKKEIIPQIGSDAKIGIGYNSSLCEFVSSSWNPDQARFNSPSLNRAMLSLENFSPEY